MPSQEDLVAIKNRLTPALRRMRGLRGWGVRVEGLVIHISQEDKDGILPGRVRDLIELEAPGTKVDFQVVTGEIEAGSSS